VATLVEVLPTVGATVDPTVELAAAAVVAVEGSRLPLSLLVRRKRESRRESSSVVKAIIFDRQREAFNHQHKSQKPRRATCSA
jgi:hypothetical protein